MEYSSETLSQTLVTDYTLSILPRTFKIENLAHSSFISKSFRDKFFRRIADVGQFTNALQALPDAYVGDDPIG